MHHQHPAQAKSGTAVRHNTPFVFNSDARIINKQAHETAHANALRTFAPESQKEKGLFGRIYEILSGAFSADDDERKKAAKTFTGFLTRGMKPTTAAQNSASQSPITFAYRPEARIDSKNDSTKAEFTGRIGPRTRELHRAAAA